MILGIVFQICVSDTHFRDSVTKIRARPINLPAYLRIIIVNRYRTMLLLLIRISLCYITLT